MASPASTKMHVVLKWSAEESSTHSIVVDRKVDISHEFNLRLAGIGNEGRFMCYTSTPREGYTAIEVAVLKGNDKRLSMSKLREIVREIANHAGVSTDYVTIELEGRMAPFRFNELCEMMRLTGGDFELPTKSRQQQRTLRSA